MRRNSLIVVQILVGAMLVLPGSGCGSKLKWRVLGPHDGSKPMVGPLRIEVSPVDTTELKKGHPFRWRRSKTAGFMLFDVKITNTGDRDLLCQMGHLDFPGLVITDQAQGSIMGGAALMAHTSVPPGLIGTDDLNLAALNHERATILMEEGYRYPILSYGDFSERYCYLMQKEMSRARALAYIPYAGGFIAAAKMHSATQNRPKRMMEAQQMVLRPGVVPAGSTVRGYLVFAWPPDVGPGNFTLRMPIQPAHAATCRFNIVRRD
ncbi:MAG: hypothetical protein ABIG44_16710 [Planctomycetota bacterium]